MRDFQYLGIEAEVSGLPAIFSDTISNDVIITENSYLLPITDSTIWCKKIRELENIQRGSAIFTENAKKYDNRNMKEQFNIIIY